MYGTTGTARFDAGGEGASTSYAGARQGISAPRGGGGWAKAKPQVCAARGGVAHGTQLLSHGADAGACLAASMLPGCCVISAHV